MNSQYFAQYLLNAGVLSQEAMSYLLGKARGRQASLPLLVIRQGLVTRGDAEALLASEDFKEAAVKQEILTQEEAERLLTAHPGETLRFGQCLLDEGILTLDGLLDLLNRYDQESPRPAKEAVARVAGSAAKVELPLYEDFMELFMESLMEFLETPAVIDVGPVEMYGSHKVMYAVSQRLEGKGSLVSGIAAYAADFVELSRRYSGEDIETVDELSIDSLEEFLNVVNGVFSVREATSKGSEFDLTLPRWGKVRSPVGNNQLIMRIYTDFGSFLTILATDEFI